MDTLGDGQASQASAATPPIVDPAVPSVSPSLILAAGWAWRLLLVAGAFVALAMLLRSLYLVTLPVFFAILLTALLHPVAALLRRWGFSRLSSTLTALAVALVVVGGIGWFVVSQAVANSQDLGSQVQALLTQAQGYAEKLPFVNSGQLKDLSTSLVSFLETNSATLAKDAVSVGSATAETATGLILAVFLTFFFLNEGDGIWGWLVRLAPKHAQASVLGAGHRAWSVVSGWVLGTALIAAFHGIVMGIVLMVLGVPLAVPLGVLVFVGSFVPVVGVLVFGGLSVVVTLLTQGWVFALIVFGVLIATGQVEAHVLQPFIVGRAVRMHPVAIVLSLTTGALIAGIVGAIVAIPVVAATHAAVKYLTGVEDLNGVVRTGNPDRMAPAVPLLYAPLPLYAGVNNVVPDDEVPHDDGPEPEPSAPAVIESAPQS
ncbi:AI-2E family transporter [Tessaracoccus sp.]